MQKVVSNSTPIIHLSKMGYLNLLEQLYGKIYVTNDVYEECTSIISPQEEVKQEIETIKAAPFILIGSAGNNQLITALSQMIDIGEATAFALAIEFKANLILLDDSEFCE